MLRILLVRFSSIGDILLTTPLIRALRRRHPDAELIFVTKRAMVPLVGDNPHLTRVEALEPGESIRRLARRLRGLQATDALDLHGSLRSRVLRVLLPGRWHGYRKRKFARGLLIATKINLHRHVVPVPERYFEAAAALDVQPDSGGPEFFVGPGARVRVTEWLAAHARPSAGQSEAPLAVLAPGAAHATKRWPLEQWGELAERLGAAGYRLVVAGGAEDRALAAAPGLADRADNSAGEFSLQETGALLARARICIAGDTGVMHMATAVGTPVVALFGPTVEAFGFFPYHARATVLQRDLDCRPCSSMGSERCPLGHHRCLAAISAAEVVTAVDRLVA
ncbi:MAG TPA: glycosyltransferase family 9 protein [Gemmatimonadales bacterium]|nr:glycosyltransferase family 9 protein [Gemmatimonadales bacterium]